MANRQASLLWHCCRFQAILNIQEGVSVFKVVETNDFNQLPHITLAFRPGNDATVKAFLAGRLSEVQAVQAALERDLSRAQVSSACHAWPRITFAISPPQALRNLHFQADSGRRRAHYVGEAPQRNTHCMHLRFRVTSSQNLQAEASSKGEQLCAAQQALTQAMAAHERYIIEAEARARSEAAEAVRLKTHELMQQKETLDRFAALLWQSQVVPADNSCSASSSPLAGLVQLSHWCVPMIGSGRAKQLWSDGN